MKRILIVIIYSLLLQSADAQSRVADSLSTKKIEDKVEIRIKDNGNGIPKEISDKIFQPLLTTKSTGHGTGLGLSLAYDTVKAHGGEIKYKNRKRKGNGILHSITTSKSLGI